MLNKQKNSVLFVIVVLLGFAAWVTSRSFAPEVNTPPPLFSDLSEFRQVLKTVELQSDDAQLVMQNVDGVWQLQQADGYPVAIEPLRALINALSDGRLVETKTSNPEKYSRLQVSSLGEQGAGVLVRVVSSDSKQWSVIIGKSAEGSGGTYVRKPDESVSYLLDREVESNLKVADWLKQPILNIPESQVTGVSVTASENSFSLTRVAEDADAFLLLPPPDSGKQLAEGYKLSGFFGAIEALNLLDVFKQDSDRLPNNWLIERNLTYQISDGSKYQVNYRQNEQGRHFVSVSASQATDSTDESQPTPVTANSTEDESAVENKQTEALKKSQEDISGWVFEISNFKGEQFATQRSDLLTDLEM